MPRFLEEGIWENGYKDKYLDLVKSILPGDRIAIKASYTRKYNLPFDNKGQSVSVMSIKATGTVKENLGDGRKVRVEWTKLDPQREWYFYTHRGTIWRVLPGEWTTDALIGFAFEGKPQDLGPFRNSPFGGSGLVTLLQTRNASNGRRFMRQLPIITFIQEQPGRFGRGHL